MEPTVIADFRVETFTARLKRPFVTSLGRKDESRNVGITVRLRDGSLGYGEASSSLALAHLSPERLAAALRRIGRSALGRDAADAAALAAAAWKAHPDCGPAVSAFEAAVLEAWLAGRGATLAGWLGGAREEVESDATISASGAAEAAGAAAEAAAEGFRLLKVKVGGDLAENLARVRAALGAMPRCRGLVLDGNQGMTVAGALKLADLCLGLGARVELLEQPLPRHDAAGMRALTRRSPVPVAADEMVHAPADAVAVADGGLASAINIKLAKSGIFRALEIASVARAAGLGLMIGCMAESGRGLSASVHLALGTGFFRWVDLDSDYLHLDARPPLTWERRGPRLVSRAAGARPC